MNPDHEILTLEVIQAIQGVPEAQRRVNVRQGYMPSCNERLTGDIGPTEYLVVAVDNGRGLELDPCNESRRAESARKTMELLVRERARSD